MRVGAPNKPSTVQADFGTYPAPMPRIWDNNGRSQGTSSAAFLKGEQRGE